MMDEQIKWCEGFRRACAAFLIQTEGDDPYLGDTYGGNPFVDGMTQAMGCIISMLKSKKKEVVPSESK